MFRFFPQKNKYHVEEMLNTFNRELPVPQHIAVIMDGNGRWANNRRLPRVAGHKEGMNNVKKITKKASQLGVKVLTLYAFSTENWRRPDSEVSFLMQLPVDFFDTFVPELIEENVKVQVIGYTDALPAHTKQAVDSAIEQTAHCTGMILNFALNYGSRAEILTGINQLIDEAKSGELTEEVTEELFSNYLMTSVLPKAYQDPDLVIRTSGEERISNFLLWQIAYSELYFSKVYWPDFSESHLEEAIGSFQARNRRFGGLNETKENK
ncbi:isoprenyl transferase [Vagococcus xieshaowenii]|uniref:Isoprenyl transferase n=1 Tax=Vagococcus xieshaowenii TaxID=2562451 RepID=A0AAJ5EF21_9ENTE|nr:isoprenyl transferase [Vagococcus xieshaowenii]QCA28175.1 isoprenyl transferase [Vagococcus xieshaowenii]TFZ42528.1 isoprenyl transferase [Vagococcus xieshaowenii]